MQHRRFRKHDHYGVGEPLNETDPWGHGIQVKANYFMFVSNLASKDAAKTASHQRELQRRLDQPMLLYFSKEFNSSVLNSTSLATS